MLNGVLVGSITGVSLPINVPSAPNNKSVLFAKKTSVTLNNPLTFPNGWVSSPAPWTSTSAGFGVASTTNGILTLNGTGGGDQIYYTQTGLSSLPSNGQFFETKFKLGNWRDVGKCSKSCGTGKILRKRDVIVEPFNFWQF